MMLRTLCAGVLLWSSTAQADQPEGLPRFATEAEKIAEAARPAWTIVPRGPGTAPTGRVKCPGEYAPADGIVLSYHPNYQAVLPIVVTMAAHITTTGQAKAYVVFPTPPSAATLMQFQNAGANMSRIIPLVNGLDSIWMRDYGPRYIFEGVDAQGNGGCRAIIDHTYNRPLRTIDDAFPAVFAAFRNQTRYVIPLIHGGGNHHLDSLGRAYATRLIANENPQLGATNELREAAVVSLWRQYQNIGTTITDPFPTAIDATQHIDMWAQVIADDKIMISQWPTVAVGNATYEPFRITELETTALAAPTGPYTVYRVPGRSISGVHYTYTNVVMCNNLVLVPSYTNTTMVPLNAQAVAAYQAALPGKTIVPVNCQALVTLAGVMHCIAMHVPKPQGDDDGSGNLAPTVYVKTLNSGESVAAGPTAPPTAIRWMSDDDTGIATTGIDIALSLDGGATWPATIASGVADTGFYNWFPPNYFSKHARLRVTAHDTGSPSRTGFDLTDADFRLAGTCRGDFNNSLSVTVQDVFDFLAAYFAGSADADFNESGSLTVQDVFDFLGAFFTPCP